MRKLSIIGSTGSVGTTTLRVVKNHPQDFSIVALAAKDNVELLAEQAQHHKPRLVCLFNEHKYLTLKKMLSGMRTKIVCGDEGLEAAAVCPEADRIVFSLNGTKGLVPLLRAIESKKDIAIANKELLVIAGDLIMSAVKNHKVHFIPIDSEHSAIFQCIEGHKKRDIKTIILTASGGPFVDVPIQKLARVTPEQALKHPRWRMGKKISIDSATMMNKGLEVIEASVLYGIPLAQISVIVHRESIIHSLVEFIDSSMLAQLSHTDMSFPVLYALGYPTRIPDESARLDLAHLKALSFERPQIDKFPCLSLAYAAGEQGGTMTTVLNAANEVAVQLFLEEKIKFIEIPQLIEDTMRRHRRTAARTLKDVLQADAWAREEAMKWSRY